MESIEIVNVYSAEDLQALYNESALTIEGLAQESIPDFVNWVEGYTKLKMHKVYLVSGSTMNTYCGNTGDNAYPDDLNIVAIKLSDIEDMMKIVLPRFQIGGRWFDDVVENNRRREEKKTGNTEDAD